MHLRNNEHVQFQSRFRDLVTLFMASLVKIDALFNLYLQLFLKEDEAFDVIRKSDFAQQIEDADDLRDNTFRGMGKSMESSHKHFRAEVRQAAARLQVVFDFYGDLANEPQDGETSDVNKFLGDLTGKYAADVATVGLTEWVTELKANNDAFDQLKKSRTTEAATRTHLKMKMERAYVDVAYLDIIQQINALMLVEGEANYVSFVNELNSLIDEYSNTMAIRKGRNAIITPVVPA